jgi:hypothetical protein
MIQFEPFVYILLCLLICGRVAWKVLSEQKELAAMRENAIKSYQTCCIDSADTKFRFSAQSAKVICSQESFNPRRHPAMFSMTIFARNEAGEYFLFISSVDKPFVKHLTHERAKLVLGSEYVQ